MKKMIAKLGVVLVLWGLVCTPAVFAAEDGPQWEVVTNVPGDGLLAHSVATIDTKLYVIGGGNDTASYSTQMQVYDITTKEWSSGPSLSIGRRNFGLGILDEKIYVFGGDISGGATDSIEVFDPKLNQWTVAPTTLPSANSGFSTAVVNGKVYIIGGYSTSAVEIYNPESNTWSKGAPLPSRTSSMSCVAVNERIYVLGGMHHTSSGAIDSLSDKVLCYDPIKNTWAEVGNLPRGLHRASACEYNNTIVILGGNTSYYSFTQSETYIYDLKTNVCKSGPLLRTSRETHATVIVGNMLYAVAGYHQSLNGPNTISKVLSSVEALDLSQLIPPESTPKLSVLLNPNETVQLSVSADLADNAFLTWASSDSAVATVDASGKVTAVAPGQCQITAKNAAGTFEESIPVKVVAGEADDYRLAVHLRQGQRAKLYLADDPTGITWQSLDPAIATVDAGGKVTALADGLVLVQASQNGQTHQIYVRVKS